MPATVSIAQTHHQPWLTETDRAVDESWVSRCLALEEYLVAERDGSPVGFLRWSWFWGKVPYMDMVYVEPSCRGSGIGTALLDHWLDLAAAHGTKLVMTSCEAGEKEPLAWHLGHGFEPVGEVDFPTIQEAREVFLAKRLV